MTNKERVSNNLQITVDGIKSEKVQEVVTSLAIISQCQIDISYTLASMLDEMREKKVKSIPLDKVKQAKEQMLDSKFYGKTVATYNDAIEDCVEILDKLIAESEEINGKL